MQSEVRGKARCLGEGLDTVAPLPRARLALNHMSLIFKQQHCCAALLKRPIRRELRELCNGFAKEGAPYKATNTYAHLRKLHRWAAPEELIKVNVLAGIDNPR
jgi:hypothetical protein